MRFNTESSKFYMIYSKRLYIYKMSNWSKTFLRQNSFDLWLVLLYVTLFFIKKNIKMYVRWKKVTTNTNYSALQCSFIQYFWDYVNFVTLNFHGTTPILIFWLFFLYKPLFFKKSYEKVCPSEKVTTNTKKVFCNVLL